MKKYFAILFLFEISVSSAQLQPLKISANNRFIQAADGKPFFWLGDTGWLLFMKCKREQAIQYLDDRQKKGFNVIQVMVLHDLAVTSAYGDSALVNGDISTPRTTQGNSIGSKDEYDYWDNVDFVVDEASKRGIYMAMVAVWGRNIKSISVSQAKIYAEFLAKRYKEKSNIIWLNGGDVNGSEALDKWNMIGNTLNENDNNHLITFHPRGRNSSSAWFHNEAWLDFNMFQSGHRTYIQDTSSNETLHYGEDNWRYVKDDYQRTPIKPTLDGEPSYEDIPYGLHYSTEPTWKDHQVRRYAWWSVLTGGCGFTYGNNEVMQFFTPGIDKGSYFPKISWQEGLNTPGSSQMQYLKSLFLSLPFFNRVPGESLINNQGERYDYLAATLGVGFGIVYTYTGRDISINLGKFKGDKVKCRWYNPRNGTFISIGTFNNNGSRTFNPPGKVGDGNDWVLLLQGV